MPEWDAARYHRISDPQLAWGRAVAARLEPKAGERILDLGCGTGRLTGEIAESRAIVIGLDSSAAMLREARARRVPVGAGNRGSGAQLGGASPSYVQGDGTALPFVAIFDAAFSTATFHWILDHGRLFASIHHALKPGGRLVAQCGGAGNLDRLYGRARALMARPPYVQFYPSWKDPWLFAGIQDTRTRLEDARFVEVEVALVPAPTTFDGPEAYAEFIAAVCLRHELERLPGDLRAGYLAELTRHAAEEDPPFTLDYWRLNISARTPQS